MHRLLHTLTLILLATTLTLPTLARDNAHVARRHRMLKVRRADGVLSPVLQGGSGNVAQAPNSNSSATSSPAGAATGTAGQPAGGNNGGATGTDANGAAATTGTASANTAGATVCGASVLCLLVN